MGFDFFRTEGLPAPTISGDEAAALASLAFGLQVDGVRDLGSQQDRNVLLTDAAGAPIAVLKIANQAFGAAELAAQDAAAAHVGRVTGLRVADALRPAVRVDSSIGPVVLRLIRFVPGGTLVDAGGLSPRRIAAMGSIAGRVSAALASFDVRAHRAGLDRVLQWDPKVAPGVVALLASQHPDAGEGERIAGLAEAAWKHGVAPVADRLPQQPCHLDLTDDNLVVGADGLPDGVIDFGDLSVSWRVGELAATVASLLAHGAAPHETLSAIAAFHAEIPLSAVEVAALWPLVVVRGAVLVLSSAQQLGLDGDNAYTAARVGAERAVLEAAASVPVPVMTALIAHRLGMPLPRWRRGELPPIAALGDRRHAVLDLDVTADAVDDGAWLAPDASTTAATALRAAGVELVTTRFGAVRLDLATPLTTTAPATVALGVEVHGAYGAPLAAPFSGVVRHDGDRVLLEGASTLALAGVLDAAEDGDVLLTGDRLGRAGALLRLTHGVVATPFAVAPAEAPGWFAVTADPTDLLGLAAADATDPDAAPTASDAPLLARRAAVLADVQEHYFTDPPRIERGWGALLIAHDGRPLVDMVNNVASIGHAHPALTEAVARQLRRLNTNSRFHSGVVVEYAERLAALLPDPLDTVLLVNSGSEAVDLALRIATVATGRRDVVTLAEAYHGWTTGTDAVSTSIGDNPRALGSRPDWVHPLEAPNPIRGRLRGAAAAGYAADAVAAIRTLAATGRVPAAFLAETLFGNGGGVALPDGYLAAVFAAVRESGGLAIADEVQVGFGRLGHRFWGFEGQGVIPDIVAVAKSIGAGMPLGAVVTTRAIAERFAADGPFFSSTGGSPVSAAAGLAVLDVIEREGLQANAAAVGDRLHARLELLALRHPIIGAVHGEGLFLGVELVRDRGAFTPATEEAAAICERLLGYGVIEQPTGDHKNVLKVKPPLVLDAAGADFFVEALDRVLTEGW